MAFLGIVTTLKKRKTALRVDKLFHFPHRTFRQYSCHQLTDISIDNHFYSEWGTTPIYTCIQSASRVS